MTEVERNWRRPPPQPQSPSASEAPISSTSEMSNGKAHDTSVKRRVRSNSKSTPSKSSTLTSGNAFKQKSEIESLQPAVAPRNKYTHIIILKSLNETFETKFLVVPFKPDSLKLGRPVLNSNSSSQSYGVNGSTGNIGKVDSQQAPQVRPDNGHFDSRVLSRNHASLSCDINTGKIYIRDLKSSNGTFVNGNRIDQQDVELKVGNIIDLGTDIDSKFEHRKISAFVEDISVIPLINEVPSNGPTNGKLGEPTKTEIGTENGSGYSVVSATTAQRAAFEAAMFGDVNNLDLEDTVLGSETEILSGIFINNSIGTSPNLINVIKTLATEVALEKHEFTKLRSMENFLINYTTNLEYVNKLLVEKNDKQLAKLQNALKQKLTERQGLIIQEHKAQLEKMERENLNMKSSFETQEREKLEHVKSLTNDIEDLRTRLEVEKYRNSQLAKSNVSIDQDSTRQVIQINEKATHIKDPSGATDETRQTPGYRKLGGGALLIMSAISVGLVAYAMTFSSEQHI